LPKTPKLIKFSFGARLHPVDVGVEHCNATLRKMFSKRKLFTTLYWHVKENGKD